MQLGLLISSYSTSPAEAHQLLNFIIGFGIAGTGFGPILAVVGRSTLIQRKRSLALRDNYCCWFCWSS